MSTSELEKPSGSGPVEEALRRDTVRRLCGEPVITVVTGTPLAAALSKLRLPQSRGAVLVVDPQGRGPAGIFTQRDFLDKFAAGESSLSGAVDGAMTPAPTTLPADAPIADAIRLMTEGGYRHVPVVCADGEVLGVVSARDVVTYLAEHFPAEVLNLPPDPNQHNGITTREGG